MSFTEIPYGAIPRGYRFLCPRVNPTKVRDERPVLIKGDKYWDHTTQSWKMTHFPGQRANTSDSYIRKKS